MAGRAFFLGIPLPVIAGFVWKDFKELLLTVINEYTTELPPHNLLALFISPLLSQNIAISMSLQYVHSKIFPRRHEIKIADPNHFQGCSL
jgi:hypothetical protein